MGSFVKSGILIAALVFTAPRPQCHAKHTARTCHHGTSARPMPRGCGKRIKQSV